MLPNKFSGARSSFPVRTNLLHRESISLRRPGPLEDVSRAPMYAWKAPLCRYQTLSDLAGPKPSSVAVSAARIHAEIAFGSALGLMEDFSVPPSPPPTLASKNRCGEVSSPSKDDDDDG
jgi:hypothetical protein